MGKHIIDAFERSMRERQRELMREGMSEQAAEDQALAEARREIRAMPPKQFRAVAKAPDA